MAYIKELSDCSIKLRCKTGTLSSGADAINTYTFGGASQNADAETIMDFSNACASLITSPVLETLRVDTELIYDPDAEVEEP